MGKYPSKIKKGNFAVIFPSPCGIPFLSSSRKSVYFFSNRAFFLGKYASSPDQFLAFEVTTYKDEEVRGFSQGHSAMKLNNTA